MVEALIFRGREGGSLQYCVLGSRLDDVLIDFFFIYFTGINYIGPFDHCDRD